MGKNFDFQAIFTSLAEKIGVLGSLNLVFVLVGLFLLLIFVAFIRKQIVHFSFRGMAFGLTMGIILMILIDLIIIFSFSDKAKWQKLSEEEGKAEAIQEIAASGVENLSRVLGVSTIVSPKKPKTAQEVLDDYLNLPKNEAQKIKDLLCPQ